MGECCAKSRLAGILFNLSPHWLSVRFSAYSMCAEIFCYHIIRICGILEVVGFAWERLLSSQEKSSDGRGPFSKGVPPWVGSFLQSRYVWNHIWISLDVSCIIKLIAANIHHHGADHYLHMSLRSNWVPLKHTALYRRNLIVKLLVFDESLSKERWRGLKISYMLCVCS